MWSTTNRKNNKSSSKLFLSFRQDFKIGPNFFVKPSSFEWSTYVPSRIFTQVNWFNTVTCIIWQWGTHCLSDSLNFLGRLRLKQILGGANRNKETITRQGMYAEGQQKNICVWSNWIQFVVRMDTIQGPSQIPLTVLTSKIEHFFQTSFHQSVWNVERKKLLQTSWSQSGYGTVQKAFITFLKKVNNGKPII